MGLAIFERLAKSVDIPRVRDQQGDMLGNVQKLGFGRRWQPGENSRSLALIIRNTAVEQGSRDRFVALIEDIEGWEAIKVEIVTRQSDGLAVRRSEALQINHFLPNIQL